jgi:OOP family OmpA-OmpF porin
MEKQTNRRTILQYLAAAAAVPMLPPAAVAKPESFTIYFDFGSTELGAGAKEIVELISRAISPRGRVTLSGNCDTAETAPDKLGFSRANAVLTQFLRNKDMARVRFNVVNEGISRPLVPTPPNTKEARNRRVEIILTP